MKLDYDIEWYQHEYWLAGRGENLITGVSPLFFERFGILFIIHPVGKRQ